MTEQNSRCAYCHKERPVSEMKQGKIIFRNGRYNASGKYVKFVDQKLNNYCADKACHSNDQMAHEG